MARVAVGGSASINGTTTVPRPGAAGTVAGGPHGAEVKRAKIIALSLFALLVFLHAKGE